MPEYRGQGIYSIILKSIIGACLEEDIRYILGAIRPDNKITNVLLRNGFKKTTNHYSIDKQPYGLVTVIPIYLDLHKK